LRTLPLWLLIGLALAGYAVIFAPAFGGINPELFRQQWGVWAWIESMTFSILALARILETGAAAYLAQKQATAARRILRFVPLHHQCWWHLAKQQDDSFVSQIRMDVQASNTSGQPVQIVKVRLIRPRATLLQAGAMLPLEGSPYHSYQHAIPPHGTVVAGVHIMVHGSLAVQGKPIRITIAITDQYGEEYKVRKIKVGTHDRPSAPRRFADRLRNWQVSRLKRPDTEATKPAMPWAFEYGSEYLDVCESILQEEKRSYAACGRIRGGLGTLNVGLQSEPNYGWTQVGHVPPLLWDEDKAMPVSSPNLDRLLRSHRALPPQDRDNLERYLLSQLQKESIFAEVGYFVFLALHRMGRTVDALKTARTFLAGDRVFGYSNLLGTLAAVVSHEHFAIDPQLYPLILDALDGDEEHDFGLRQKVNLARLKHLDRESARNAQSR
jgi:hypothetical protein